MSKSAIVTGASAGIGSEISRRLCGLGFEVFGIGREFKEPAEEQLFHPIVCDLLDTQQLLQNIKDIAARGDVSVLVNNAGVAYYGLHEELNPKKNTADGSDQSGSSYDFDTAAVAASKGEPGICDQYFIGYGAVVQSLRLCLWSDKGRSCRIFPQSV